MPNPQFNKQTSKLKFVIMLKHGNNHLKSKNNLGKLVNPTFYNFDSINHKPTDYIIKKMINFLKHKPAYKNANCIMIYDNIDNIFISRVNF